MPVQVVDQQQIVQPEMAAQPALPKPEAGDQPAGDQPAGEQPQLSRPAEMSGRDDAPAPAGSQQAQPPAAAEPAAPAPEPALPPMSAAVAAVQPSGVQPSAVQPSAAEPAVTPRPQAPVPLHELPQAAEAAIRLSVRDNRTLAHITVHPEELGPVEIRLRYDENGGITASVQAGSAEAARMLADAAPDLRRALETQGLSLLGFDVRSDGRDADRGRDVPDAPQGSRREPGEPDPEPSELHLPTHVPDYFPNHGAHVDVLA